jgi:hypothetical protein
MLDARYAMRNFALHMVVAGSVVVEALCYKQKVTGSRPDEVDFFYFT